MADNVIPIRQPAPPPPAATHRERMVWGLAPHRSGGVSLTVFEGHNSSTASMDAQDALALADALMGIAGRRPDGAA